MRALLFVILCSYLFSACDPAEENSLPPEKKTPAIDTQATLEMQRFNREVNATGAFGIRGVYNVPEMLAMLILDSADAANAGNARARAFATIEEEIDKIGATPEGSPGSIYYSNDPKNFVFECLILIREMPKTSPVKSKVVVLEEGPMLICNHAGSYRNLYKSYASMKRYCDSAGLIQAGPMREFYVTSPIQSSDSSKWLTRIMLPVGKNPGH